MNELILSALFGFVIGSVFVAIITAAVDEDKIHHDYNGRNGNGYQPKSDLSKKNSHALEPPRQP